jgi:hypothetical protein
VAPSAGLGLGGCRDSAGAGGVFTLEAGITRCYRERLFYAVFQKLSL